VEESPRLTQRPNIGSDVGSVVDKQVVAAIRAPNTATLRGWAVQALENGVKIGTIYANFPNRRQGALEPAREPQTTAVGRETYPVNRAGDSNQFPSVGAIRVSAPKLAMAVPGALPFAPAGVVPRCGD